MENEAKIIQVKKNYELETKTIQFTFQGEKETDVNIEEIMKVVDYWLQGIETFEDFKTISINLKNIFRHFRNTKLRLAIKTVNQEKWGICFQDNNLVYLKGDGLTYSNHKEGFSLSYDKEGATYKTNSVVKTMQDIALAISPLAFSPRAIFDDLKTLYQIYYLFYNQEPHNMTPVFLDQVQLMIFILRELANINILHDYNFLPNKEGEIKASNLEMLAQEFQSFGYFEETEIKVVLDYDLKMKIRKLGEVIRSSIDIEDQMAVRTLLNSLYYEKNNYIYSNTFKLPDDKEDYSDLAKKISIGIKKMQEFKNKKV